MYVIQVIASYTEAFFAKTENLIHTSGKGRAIK